MDTRYNPKGVEERYRPRSHRHDVTKDSADAGRRSLEGLDCRRVVVALYLEGDREAASNIDHACVLAGPLEDARTRCRQPAQEWGLVLVGAVLRPEEREHRQLERVRLALEQLADTVELTVGEAEGAMKRLLRDARQWIRA